LIDTDMELLLGSSLRPFPGSKWFPMLDAIQTRRKFGLRVKSVVDVECSAAFTHRERTVANDQRAAI
jgi:hypothetical protein